MKDVMPLNCQSVEHPVRGAEVGTSAELWQLIEVVHHQHIIAVE